MPAGNGVSRRTALAGLIAALSAGCGKLAFMAANVPAAFGAYRRHADIAYGSHPRHRLDIYVPEPKSAADSAPPAARPLVVFWHGGRWSSGDKAEYRFVGAALAELGCVAVLPNYRLYPEVKMPGFMDDAARAGQWAALHAGEYAADCESVVLDGSLGRRPPGRSGDARPAVFRRRWAADAVDRGCDRPVGTV